MLFRAKNREMVRPDTGRMLAFVCDLVAFRNIANMQGGHHSIHQLVYPAATELDPDLLSVIPTERLPSFVGPVRGWIRIIMASQVLAYPILKLWIFEEQLCPSEWSSPAHWPTLVVEVASRASA